MKIIVEEYNPNWAEQFQQVKAQLEKILDGVSFISIEHVGSTSVPGLAAKPILDIDVIVTAANLDSTKKALTENGDYVYRGEMDVPDRHVFRKHGELPTRNLYVCIEGCQALRNHLLMRDICRRDPSVRDAYGRRKLELAQRDWAHVDFYCEAKNDIVHSALARAGMDKHELEEIRQRNIATTR